MTDADRGTLASIDGVPLYYEATGEGFPLVLLHGGVGASEMFAPTRAALDAGRRVIAVHLQGHGRTPDTDRPLGFEAMADDVAGLVRQLGLQRTDVMGHSLGAGVGYQVAIRHPDLVRKLVAVSEPVRRDGWYPEVAASMGQMGPEAARYMGQSPLAQLYPEVDWARLFGKLGELLRQDYDWSREVTAIRAQVLLVFADADAVRPEHIVELFGLLGGGKRDAGLDGAGRPATRLAVLPGMTHYDVLTFPGLGALVAAFLDAPEPTAA